MVKDWYLGLDIGTNSVGFSSTDTKYNILTKNGKLQCGARLFEAAQDASTRRGFRSSRRRFARRKVRIDLLQELFNFEIAKKDQDFFIRLNESSFYLEDKTQNCKYPLFNDKGFTDNEYYKKFPTIYHLRKYLLENKETDVRLLYLACHHLIKYRGHFLSPNFNTNRNNSDYLEKIKEINNQLSDVFFNTDMIEDILGIIQNKGISAVKQWSEIRQKLNPEDDKLLNAVFTVMQGNKIPLSKIWDELKEAEKESKDELKEFKFSSEKYEECLVAAEKILNDNQLAFLETCKSFYDLIQLDRIMSGVSYVSEAMVQRYGEHKDDLKLLKKFIKTHLSHEYDEMFRSRKQNSDHASYANYVGSNITHKEKSTSHFSMCVDKKSKEPMTATYEDFLKYTGSIIDQAKDKDGYTKLKEKIDNKTLCQIHNTKDNSSIPYQLHEIELKAILEKQNFGFLQNKDEDGTIFDKIIFLLTFRIPYYVGPLSNKHQDFAWIERNDNTTKITPWNFKKIVNTVQSGENFITRMTAKCTYLRSEDVLPKQSLIYQKYMLLNDLNNLKINGNRISQEMKTFLFNGICQTEKTLSKGKIKKYLVDQGKINSSDIIGKENENDIAFNSSLSSLIKLKEILGDKIDEEMCENIIKWHTIFGDEKDPIIQKIKFKYGEKLTEDQIKNLTKLSFKEWARLSAKFLNEIPTTDKQTGETALTIIKLLEETTLNLMEILNSEKYDPKFMNTIEDENASENGEKIDYDFIADLYCSPTVKRSIWQAILITKELKKINGCPPKKVFIEVTRGEDKKQKGKMKSSRREQIEELLDKASCDASLMNEFKSKTDEKEFRSDKLYLYFTQLGKCMYSGEKIALSELNKDNLYDIDHIYPQSKIKDDSLSNRVLVKKSHNADKANEYPIASSIQSEMKPFWALLKEKELINNNKYDRLTCTQPLTKDIIGGFINRQLVSTNQAVKETANTLKIMFGDDTKIVYSKAENISDFRHTYELIKCREVNNLHHAHDAYLNIVVGNVWDSVYGQYWDTNFTFNEDRALNTLFKKDRKDIWSVSYLQKIEAYLFDNKKYLNKFPITTRPFEKKGEFYSQTIHPKGKGQFELKKGRDTKKYGGYKNGTTSYNCLIEYDDKKKCRIRGIFSVPVRFVYLQDKELLEKITDENKLKDRNPELIIPKIQMFSTLEIDGVRYHMRSGDLQCSVAAEWYPDKELIQIVRDIFKYNKLIKDKQLTEDKETKEDIVFITREKNLRTKETKTISRTNNEKLYNNIIEQIKKPFYVNYSFATKVEGEKISREKFLSLTTYEQVEQLISLLNLITMNGTMTDAVKIGGVKNETAKYKFSNISSRNVYLITQSVTGLFENRVEIIPGLVENRVEIKM